MSISPARTLAAVIPGPAGDLEAVIEEPRAPTDRAICVACHPHPLFHGTMNNKVVHTVARSALSLGVPAVRFNFRGVGRSEGSWDEGKGETADVLSAVEWVREQWPDRPLWLGGFSFGAYVSIRAAVTAEPAVLVSIAPPVQRFAMDDMPQPACPWLVVQGSEDELVAANDVVAWAAAQPAEPQVRVIDGVDHFFHGSLTRLRKVLETFFDTGHQERMTE